MNAGKSSQPDKHGLRTMEFFLNGAELSLNSVTSEKLINH